MYMCEDRSYRMMVHKEHSKLVTKIRAAFIILSAVTLALLICPNNLYQIWWKGPEHLYQRWWKGSEHKSAKGDSVLLLGSLRRLSTSSLSSQYSTPNNADIYSGKPLNITVGVVANEFFNPTVGRTGGFGMSTNMVGQFFGEHPDLGVKIVFIYASVPRGKMKSELVKKVIIQLLGWPLVFMVPGAEKVLLDLGIDVFLLIDYRTKYESVLRVMPEKPIILWARDPRTEQQKHNLEGIRLPNDEYGKSPKGTTAPSTRRAALLFHQLEGPFANNTFDKPRKMLIGVTWLPALRDRLWEAYHIPAKRNAFELPNIIEGCGGSGVPIIKADKPTVIFVGRLDPYKRPWLMVELAKHFSDVEFLVLGRRHFTGPGSYDIQVDSGPLPTNLKLLGQESGEMKWRLLSRAWFLISTSAHEGLAISYLEALLCRTPVLSTVNPGGIVSSYGIFVGEFSGSGLQGMDALKLGFGWLLNHHAWRIKIGEQGRRHVLETHNPGRFFKGFQNIIRRLGFGIPFKTDRNKDYEDSFPTSVIIPSLSGEGILPELVANILSLKSMMHPDSEVLVSHISKESWDSRARLYTSVNRITLDGISKNQFRVSKLIHLNLVELNEKMKCASRYFAALKASNDVLIHLDDTIWPFDATLKRMIRLVRGESGFPNYEADTDVANFYGLNRGCDKSEIRRRIKNKQPDDERVLLSYFVSMSAVLNTEFVSAIKTNKVYEHMLNKHGTHACDFILEDFSRSQKQSFDLNDFSSITTFSEAEVGFRMMTGSISQSVYEDEYQTNIRGALCNCLSRHSSIECIDEIDNNLDT